MASNLARLTGGSKRKILVTTQFGPEPITTTLPVITGGEKVQTTFYSTYSDWPPEFITNTLPRITGGTKVVTTHYVTYENWIPEEFTVSVARITGGTKS